MRRALTLGIALLAAACSPPVGTNSTPATVTTPQPPLSEPEQKAVDAAKALLDRQGLSWGSPDRITRTPDGKAYWLTYPTPEKEVQVLGPRAVTVDATTGEAKLVMRD